MALTLLEVRPKVDERSSKPCPDFASTATAFRLTIGEYHVKRD